MRNVCYAVVVFLALSAATLAQNGQPSSKATADVNTTVSCTVGGQTNIVGDTVPLTCKDIFSGADMNVTQDNFVQIMSAPVKLSNSQSLFVSPSLVTGLYTDTKVSTKPSTTTDPTVSQAIAQGAVYLRAVLYDSNGNEILAEPLARCSDNILGCQQSTTVNGAPAKRYGVILDSRVQQLTQSLSQCVVNVTVGGVAGTGSCDFTLTTDLMLKTTSAHTFNFIFPNVGVGTYTLSIQAAVNGKGTIGGTATAIGAAAFGLGSVTVESVRLVHDFSF